MPSVLHSRLLSTFLAWSESRGPCHPFSNKQAAFLPPQTLSPSPWSIKNRCVWDDVQPPLEGDVLSSIAWDEREMNQSINTSVSEQSIMEVRKGLDSRRKTQIAVVTMGVSENYFSSRKAR